MSPPISRRTRNKKVQECFVEGFYSTYTDLKISAHREIKWGASSRCLSIRNSDQGTIGKTDPTLFSISIVRD